MQLQFTFDELQFLLNLVQQRDSDLAGEITRAQSSDVKLKWEDSRRLLGELENKLIEQDLQFSIDELDLLTDLVRGDEAVLAAELAQVSDRDTQQTVIAAQAKLRRIHDKLSETCAMF